MWILLINDRKKKISMSDKTNEMKEMLQKYHAGQISKDEFFRLRDTVNNAADEELENVLYEHWDAYKDYQPLPQEKVEVLYGNLQQYIKLEPVVRKKSYWFPVAAGLLLILTSGFSVAFFLQRQEIQSFSSQHVTICSGTSPSALVLLPDGTEVCLNVNSTLSYQQDFGREERKVTLSGEGYFKVQRDESKRFVVHTDVMDVTVLGTTFNMYAYEDKDFCEMALVEGSVCVNTVASPEKGIVCPT